MRYFVELSYHGKNYHGWQIQPNENSVQETIEKGLSLLLKQQVAVVGCGRTDAGVHASQFYFHFDSDRPVDKKKLKYKLNSFLPEDIAIFMVTRVKDDAHARFSALSRSYQYRISLGKNVFQNELSLILPSAEFDLNKMNRACLLMMEYTDFKCFSRSKTDVKTFDCAIREAYWVTEGNNLSFHITANRFLRNMVRAIVGTMLEIGMNRMTLEQFKNVIESKDRKMAGASVKAKGLYLTRVEYPKEIFID